MKVTETQKTINNRIKHFKTIKGHVNYEKKEKKGDISKKLCDELSTLAIELKSGSCAEDSRRLLKMLQRGANGKKWLNFERGKREKAVIRLMSEILRRKPAAAPTAFLLKTWFY